MRRPLIHVRGALLTGVVCVVWALLARRSPDLQYHFTPLIAAAIWPLSLRSEGRRTLAEAAGGGVGAATLTLLTTLGIVLAGNMEGPNFLHQGPAWPEAVLFSLLGATIGVRTATRSRPGLLGSIVDVRD